MEQRILGKSGVSVSRLCLGAMMFGDQTSEKNSANIVSAAKEAGINFIDTADVYTKGKSEIITGKIIRRQRDHWVLATKVGSEFGQPGQNQGGLSRRWILYELDQSLKRLGTDYIDVYYFHREDHTTGLEESLRAIGDAISAGKIRYFGLSNFRAWRHSEVIRLCDELGVPKPIVSQPYYNALNRMPEVEVLPVCRHHGIGVVPYSPIARGVLSGKYLPGGKPKPGSRAARKDRRMMQTEYRPESLDIAQEILEYSSARGIEPVHFAVNWVLANSAITSVIVGPRTLSQMKSYLGVSKHTWTQEDEDFVNSLVPQGHPSTPGFSDPAYPVEGRTLEV